MFRLRFLLPFVMLFAPFYKVCGQGILFENTSFSLSGGINSYTASESPVRGYSHEVVSVQFAKWLYNPFGARFGFTQIFSVNANSEESSYLCGNFSFLWDPIRCFGDVDEANWRSYLFMGAGAVHRFSSDSHSSDNDLFLTMGVNAEHRLFANVFGFAELGANFLPPYFDGNDDVEAMITIAMGLNMRFRYGTRRHFGTRESMSIGDDWYVGGGLGGNVLLTSGLVPSPTVELIVGKHFSSIWEARIHSAGIMTGTAGGRMAFAGIEADLMCNLLNLFVYNHDYHWNVSTYVGSGVLRGFSSDLSLVMAAEGGLYVRRWISPKVDLFGDLRGVVFPARFDNMGSHLMANASFGLIYNLGRSTCR